MPSLTHVIQPLIKWGQITKCNIYGEANALWPLRFKKNEEQNIAKMRNKQEKIASKERKKQLEVPLRKYGKREETEGKMKAGKKVQFFV